MQWWNKLGKGPKIAIVVGGVVLAYVLYTRFKNASTSSSTTPVSTSGGCPAGYQDDGTGTGNCIPIGSLSTTQGGGYGGGGGGGGQGLDSLASAISSLATALGTQPAAGSSGTSTSGTTSDTSSTTSPNTSTPAATGTPAATSAQVGTSPVSITKPSVVTGQTEVKTSAIPGVPNNPSGVGVLKLVTDQFTPATKFNQATARAGGYYYKSGKDFVQYVPGKSNLKSGTQLYTKK